MLSVLRAPRRVGAWRTLVFIRNFVSFVLSFHLVSSPSTLLLHSNSGTRLLAASRDSVGLTDP